MEVDWVGTKDQMADILTKVLPGPATKTFSDKLHLRKFVAKEKKTLFVGEC